MSEGGGARLATAYYELVPSMGGAQRDISRQFTGVGRDASRSFGGSFTSGLKSVIGPALALISAGAVTKFVSDSVKSLQRIERINSQTATVIKSTGGAAGVSAKHVEDLAGSLENLTASEAESIQEGANFLLTFKNIRNEAGKGNDIFDQTVVAMTDLSRATGTDMRSASLQLGKALNDPIKGISALSRVGITFTEQQKEQIKALVEGGNAMDAQKIILAELESQFGGSGEAYAKTTEGQIELAKHAIGTLGETITARALPPLGALAGFAARGLNALAEGWDPFIQRTRGVVLPIIQRIRAFLEPLVTTVRENMSEAFRFAGEQLGVFAGYVRDTVLPAIAAFAQSEGVQRAMAVVMETIRQVATNLAAAFSALWPTIQRVAGTIGDLLVQAKPAILVAFAAAFAAINVAVRIAARIIAAAARVVAGIVEWFYDWQDVLVPVAAGIGAMVAAVVAYRLVLVATMAVQRAYLAVMAAWRVATLTVAATTWLLNSALLANPIGAVILLIVGLVAAFVVAWKKSETFRNIVIGAWNGIKSATVTVFQAIKDAIQWAMDAVKNVLNFYLNGFKLVWGTIFKAIKAGVELYMNGIKLYINTVVGVIKGIFNGMRSIVGTVVGFFISIKDGAVNKFTQLVTWVTGLPGRILTAIGSLGSLLYDAGSDVVRGLWDGIKAMKDWIVDKLTGFIGEVVPGPVKDVLGIASPSRLMMQYGNWVGEGLAIGIEGSASRVASASGRLSVAAQPELSFAGPRVGSPRIGSFVPDAPTAVASAGGLTASDLSSMRLDIRLGVDQRTTAELFVAGQRSALELV